MSRHTEKIKRMIIFNKKYTMGIVESINQFKNEEVIAICNPENIGVTNSTVDTFKNVVKIKELLNKKEVEIISNAIVSSKITNVIFSGFTYGYEELILKLKEKKSKIKVKVFWHGSHAMLVERDEEYFLNTVITLSKNGFIDAIAFAKESMAEFYKLKGFNSYFLPNTVKNITIDKKYELDLKNESEQKKDNEKVYIGLYSAGSRWEKNTFNQLSAIFMVKNAVVDVLPRNELVNSFIKMMNINVTEFESTFIPRNELYARMGANDVNLYVTFTECSPVIPLESLELGVPCVTGNNHHYFKNSKLQDYLVVKSEDSIDEIYEKILYAIENKEEIIRLYKEWKVVYDKEVEKLKTKFLKG